MNPIHGSAATVRRPYIFSLKTSKPLQAVPSPSMLSAFMTTRYTPGARTLRIFYPPVASKESLGSSQPRTYNPARGLDDPSSLVDVLFLVATTQGRRCKMQVDSSQYPQHHRVCRWRAVDIRSITDCAVENRQYPQHYRACSVLRTKACCLCSHLEAASHYAHFQHVGRHYSFCTVAGPTAAESFITRLEFRGLCFVS